jgi:RNA polymerase sigma-70 factor (ECF subfamily)
MDRRALELEQLYRERYVPFRNALATVTGSRESARDAVQEAFARALAQRDDFRGDAPLAAWVWKIALRVALENRRRPQSLPLEKSVDPVLLEPQRDPELAAALRRLSPRRRLIVFLRYFGGFSYAELAAACDVSEGTIAASLAQAHRELRAAMTPNGAAAR